MIDVLAGLRPGNDRPAVSGLDSRPGDQERIRNSERAVNNRSADDNRSRKSPGEETFDDAVASAAEEKNTKGEPATITREERQDVGKFAIYSAAQAAPADGDASLTQQLPDTLSGNRIGVTADSLMNAEHSSLAAAAIFDMTGGALPFGRQSGAFSFGGDIDVLKRSAAKAAAALSALGRAGPVLAEAAAGGVKSAIMIDARKITADATGEPPKLTQDVPGLFQRIAQQYHGMPFHSGAAFDLDGAFNISMLAEFSDFESGLRTAFRQKSASSLHQPGIIGGNRVAYSALGALTAAPILQAFAQGESNLVTELGPVEFGAAKIHEAQVQMASPVLQAAAPTAAVAAQIVAAMKADRIGNTIEVRLDPPELGRVRIDFAVETADAVRAVVTAERAETLDYLRRNAAQLENELRSAGFASIDLEFANHQEAKFTPNGEGGVVEFDGDPTASPIGENMIYLTMRDDARLDMLV